MHKNQTTPPAKDTREVWLRGPLPGFPPLVQPVAHALLQAREEITEILDRFPEQLLWERPAGLATVGFHLQHLTGVLDRLLTYARAEALNPEQLAYLATEGKPIAAENPVAELVQRFHDQVEKALAQLKQTSEEQLREPRGVGRAQLPSTVMGLYVHAAEHTMRHIGQLLVTARVLQDWRSQL